MVAAQTPKPNDALGEQFVAGVALYGGDQVLPFGDRLHAVPISALWNM